jgi:hypothetical protein
VFWVLRYSLGRFLVVVNCRPEVATVRYLQRQLEQTSSRLDFGAFALMGNETVLGQIQDVTRKPLAKS